MVTRHNEDVIAEPEIFIDVVMLHGLARRAPVFHPIVECEICDIPRVGEAHARASPDIIEPGGLLRRFDILV